MLCDSEVLVLRRSSERLTFHPVVMCQSVLFVGDGQDAALLYIDGHLPCVRPFDKDINVFWRLSWSHDQQQQQQHDQHQQNMRSSLCCSEHYRILCSSICKLIDIVIVE